MTKADARRLLRALPPLPPEEAAERSRAICTQARSLAAWEKARVVALYAASEHEPALNDLWEHDTARTFAFPRVEGQGVANERLAFYRVKSRAELLESRWGLREPASDSAKLVQPEDIDLVLVPGTGFTLSGKRLGRGRGHYDRFLPHLRADATVIGVCFRERLLPELPVERHDHRMHAILSA
jgi:5-formyltetrahydrofolate cyclo-ligase